MATLRHPRPLSRPNTLPFPSPIIGRLPRPLPFTTLKTPLLLRDSFPRFPSLSLSRDSGAVYLAKLKHPPFPQPPTVAETSNSNPTALLAAKVMDRKELANRKKEGKARTEREILGMLGHPFLPKLYTTIESPKLSCLLTEFCPSGDLHVLRQLQPCNGSQTPS